MMQHDLGSMVIKGKIDSFYQAPFWDTLSLEAGCHTVRKPMYIEGLHGDVPAEAQLTA